MGTLIVSRVLKSTTFKRGAKAVININYKNNLTANEQTFNVATVNSLLV